MAGVLEDMTTPSIESDLRTLREDVKLLRSDLRTDIQEIRHDVSRLTRDAAGTATLQGRHAVQAVEQRVEDHPLASVLLALSFGLGLGLLFGRWTARE